MASSQFVGFGSLLPSRPAPTGPWLAAATLRAGQVLVGFADAHQLHLAVMLVTYAVTFLCRGGMALATTFAAHVLLVLGCEACQAPFSIMSDVAAAAASTSVGFGMGQMTGGQLGPAAGRQVHAAPNLTASLFASQFISRS